MKYLCLIYNDEREMGTMPKPDGEKMMAEYSEFTESIKKSGHYKGGDALQPTTTATTVRVRQNIDAKDLNDAISVAGRIPGAKTGSVEVRPVRVFAA